MSKALFFFFTEKELYIKKLIFPFYIKYYIIVLSNAEVRSIGTGINSVYMNTFYNENVNNIMKYIKYIHSKREIEEKPEEEEEVSQL